MGLRIIWLVSALLLCVAERTAFGTLDLGFELRAFSADEPFSQARLAGLQLEGRWVPYLNSRLLQPRIHLQLRSYVGQNSYRFQDEWGVSSPLFLREALIEISPSDQFRARVGVLSQDDWKMGLLFSDQSFPAVEERLTLFSEGETELTLTAQQQIPSSPTSQFPFSQEESTPLGFVEQLSLKFPLHDFWDAAITGGHFSFFNLPSSLSSRSRFQGNTIDSFTNRTSQFRYGFHGAFGSLEVKWHMNNQLTPMLLLSGVRNFAAPNSASNAWLIGGRVQWKINESLWLVPRLQFFFLESDSSPATYTPKRWGHNNRTGWELGISLDVVKEKIHSEFVISRGLVLDPNPYQADVTFIGASISAEQNIL